MEAMHNVDEVLKDPSPDVLVMELAGSTVNIRARWWIKPPRRADDLASRDVVLSAIKRKLVENGIDLPYPTQQILFHDQTEETDGNRLLQRERLRLLVRANSQNLAASAIHSDCLLKFVPPMIATAR